MKNPYLVGERIYLRPIERSDAPSLQRYINDPRVRQTLAVHRPYSLTQEEDWIESAAERGDLVLGIALQHDDRLIGSCALSSIQPRDRSCCFGISIGEPEEWGKGHGTEATRLVTGHAFDVLNMNRVWLLVYEYNPAAVRTYEKVGFRREGVLRQYTWRDGRFWDCWLMAVLAEDWYEGRDGE